MVNEKFILIGLYASYIVTLIFMLLPDTDKPVMTFPFGAKYELSLRTYVFHITERIGLMILFYFLGQTFSNYGWALNILFWLELIGIIDYTLTYNWTWFYIGKLSIEFALIKVLAFTGIILTTLFKK